MRQEIEIAQLREENLILRSEIYFWTEDYGYLQQKYLNYYSINQVSIRLIVILFTVDAHDCDRAADTYNTI